MNTRRTGGMIEFIPSGGEVRKRLLQEHGLELIGLIHQRLARLEGRLGDSPPDAAACSELLDPIQSEIEANDQAQNRLMALGDTGRKTSS